MFLAGTSFEATSSIFSTTDENLSFSISTSGDWYLEGGEKNIDKLKNFLELRYENDI